MTNITPITVAYGDGVGPEMVEAVLFILQEAEVPVMVESIEVGERIYRQGAKDGMLPGSLPLLMRTGILLMGPITIPMHHKCEPLDLALTERFDLTYSEAFDATQVKSGKHQGYQTTGKHFALFASTASAAPKDAGKNTVNPSPMLEAAILMLQHIGQEEVAKRIFTAWQTTLAAGLHTRDMYGKGSREKLGTREFAEAVVARLTL